MMGQRPALLKNIEKRKREREKINNKMHFDVSSNENVDRERKYEMKNTIVEVKEISMQSREPTLIRINATKRTTSNGNRSTSSNFSLSFLCLFSIHIIFLNFTRLLLALFGYQINIIRNALLEYFRVAIVHQIVCVCVCVFFTLLHILMRLHQRIKF